MGEMLLALLIAVAPLAAAVDESDPDGGVDRVAGRVVTIEPIGDSRIEVDGTHYRGLLTITGHDDGIAVVETTDIDTYLEGIAEVPFSWHPQALRAQAVAARTYLAWTLSRGRSSMGRRYGYDICATPACQVYAGVDLAEGSFGRPWREAVADTTDEVLLFNGSPAQALYSSTSRGRTRNVEDVFPGATPTPYLVAVDSPNEDSPFVSWEFQVTQDQMTALLEYAGLLAGDLERIHTNVTDDGGGSWVVVIEGSEGTERIGTWNLRTALNSAARNVLPDVFPVARPDNPERRYPTTILGPSFTIETTLRFVPPIGGAPPSFENVYVVSGGGWGHDVGMSQFGAQAMAERGASYAEILSHYYTGLAPAAAPQVLPEIVDVGLATERETMSVSSDGPVSVSVDDQVVVEVGLGTWDFAIDDGVVLVTPPEGLGLEPSISDLTLIDGFDGPVGVSATLAAPAEVRISVYERGGWVPVTPWTVVGPGSVRWSWSLLAPARRSATLIKVESLSPEGYDSGVVAWVPGAE